MKQIEELTRDDIKRLLLDLHATMWRNGGCEVCAHCKLVHREPYYKTTCDLIKQDDEISYPCEPLWRGLA